MIAIALGTRPEIIKLSPLIHELKRSGLEFEIIHSNQHYSKEMDADFFEQLQLPQPAFNLRAGGGSHAEQTAKIMIGIEKYCHERKPELLIVHGDTNTTLAAALASRKLHVPVAHVEAGLRSRDERMPEEINRIITDKISNILFAPTQEAVQNLLQDGVLSTRIKKTGNTIVDVIYQYTKSKKLTSVQKINPQLSDNNFFLATIHRPSNVDTKENLHQVINLLAELSKAYDKIVFWPIHPRTKNNLQLFGITVPERIHLDSPVSYFEMLSLISRAFVIATDSGGIQEEAYILKKPLITLRDSTERPETLKANFLVELNYDKAIKAIETFLSNNVVWDNALGDGTAAKQMVSHIKDFLRK